MKEKFRKVISHIIGSETAGPLCGIKVKDLFRPGRPDDYSTAASLNSAFIIALCGMDDPQYEEALRYLNSSKSDLKWGQTARFYLDGLDLVLSEIEDRCIADSGFAEELKRLYLWLISLGERKDRDETIKRIWQVFFPEGALLRDKESRDEQVKCLREKRKVSISRLNPSPVKDPVNQILFTSNILMTAPGDPGNINAPHINPDQRQALRRAVREDQVWWYDHPVPIDADPLHSEILHGLEGLEKAVEFEKGHGTAGKDHRLNCVLSVSVTHPGLRDMAREYIEYGLDMKKFRHLNIFVFSETGTARMTNEVLIPAARRYFDCYDHNVLENLLGVDGEYGRHYSFLKAISAFWNVFVDPAVKATFKIDLDQVFPQKELTEQTRYSAFDHFKTPLWGSQGIDSSGNKVELGMIAGALVNRNDIKESLFTPDIKVPGDEVCGEDLIFFSPLPQAVSTEAEMMTRYEGGEIDGKNCCIQRIHVTGGTTGILVESLMKYRPFTPSFVGRAEDQAYIMSVLEGGEIRLRCLHKSGLIMRHDKDLINAELLQSAEIDKQIGDYLRILVFSFYARSLPGAINAIKAELDPYTGCFISRIPVTLVYLRFALKAVSMIGDNSGRDGGQLPDFIIKGAGRLNRKIREMTSEANPLAEQFKKEVQGWNLFYDILMAVRKAIAEGDPFALGLKKKALDLLESCRAGIS
ncbi:MAG TPA: hypothetical protein ENN86_00465 [Desulfobacteraceae bacterium]|nr:hypothetical protein [Desulfobacteraceae bacterium]